MTAPYRILVTGSRDWTDAHAIAFHLDAAALDGHGREIVVVHGACPSGADFIADQAARDLGFGTEPHPADWDRYGRMAGPLRNAEMVAAGAEVCLCFVMPCAHARCAMPFRHDSHGASDCAARAEKAGIPVRRYAP